jgi:hypothetical protein
LNNRIIISFQEGHHSLFRFRILTFEICEPIWKFGRTPWRNDQPDARPLPIRDNTTQKNANTHIYASSEIRTHDPSVGTAEDSRGALDCAAINIAIQTKMKHTFRMTSQDMDRVVIKCGVGTGRDLTRTSEEEEEEEEEEDVMNI